MTSVLAMQLLLQSSGLQWLRCDRNLPRSLRVVLNWMLVCWHARRSNILADEVSAAPCRPPTRRHPASRVHLHLHPLLQMGLGKTVQVLKTLWWLCERRGVEGPFLVVAPLATLWHWKREAEQWTGLRCEVLRCVL